MRRSRSTSAFLNLMPLARGGTRKDIARCEENFDGPPPPWAGSEDCGREKFPAQGGTVRISRFVGKTLVVRRHCPATAPVKNFYRMRGRCRVAVPMVQEIRGTFCSSG